MENTALFDLRCFQVFQRGISTGRLKIYTINSSKYCVMNECNTTIIALRGLKHPSRGANWPSDVAVTVNINAELNLSLICWQLTPIIECISRDLVREYCQGLESSAVYTAPPFFVESLHGRSSRSLPHLPLHMHAEENIATF